ncbi:uncharacterized protein LACBIDRAFT_295616 [Laccaria bicolor S238N-H82]|uniref:Predicted protein n=1 Tax=Laccaria bicolor (strain S238N-H82 / ATCC MYA-4686) TaxID=486041 RepID=B0DW02_LACBS|nr:uncharacterized protein LACBIDRAFT_295616 [Laccaria bicolor S238N-H82]EDR01261.1 predicted protein [Laccaria bicolor S238N-H82]|eukprot:XP_001888137.1 predicted protein [Laccaria bicolor S238N-H82]
MPAVPQTQTVPARTVFHEATAALGPLMNGVQTQEQLNTLLADLEELRSSRRREAENDDVREPPILNPKGRPRERRITGATEGRPQGGGARAQPKAVQTRKCGVCGQSSTCLSTPSGPLLVDDSSSAAQVSYRRIPVTVHDVSLCDVISSSMYTSRQREDWGTSPEDCVTDLYVPYHPLGLDSRTPGIGSGLYDDVLRTTCGRNEILMRCREEGSCAGTGSRPAFYRRLNDVATPSLMFTQASPPFPTASSTTIDSANSASIISPPFVLLRYKLNFHIRLSRNSNLFSSCPAPALETRFIQTMPVSMGLKNLALNRQKPILVQPLSTRQPLSSDLGSKKTETRFWWPRFGFHRRLVAEVQGMFPLSPTFFKAPDHASYSSPCMEYINSRILARRYKQRLVRHLYFQNRRRGRFMSPLKLQPVHALR